MQTSDYCGKREFFGGVYGILKNDLPQFVIIYMYIHFDRIAKFYVKCGCGCVVVLLCHFTVFVF